MKVLLLNGPFHCKVAKLLQWLKLCIAKNSNELILQWLCKMNEFNQLLDCILNELETELLVDMSWGRLPCFPELLFANPEEKCWPFRALSLFFPDLSESLKIAVLLWHWTYRKCSLKMTASVVSVFGKWHVTRMMPRCCFLSLKQKAVQRAENLPCECEVLNLNP